MEELSGGLPLVREGRAARPHRRAHRPRLSAYERLGTTKDPVAAYAWILAASKAGDHRGDDFLPALRATLDQQELAQATRQAQSLNGTAFQHSIQLDLVPE
jgi:hypothetical protein